MVPNRATHHIFVTGNTEIRSNEGNVPGDFVAIAVYALDINPLIWWWLSQ